VAVVPKPNRAGKAGAVKNANAILVAGQRGGRVGSLVCLGLVLLSVLADPFRA
jgi:hypothetical protein